METPPPTTPVAPTAEEVAALNAQIAALKSERDAATQRANELENERASDKIETAITAALRGSGMIAHNYEDAAAMLRPLMVLNSEGKVVTKTGVPNVMPGITCEQQLSMVTKIIRPHWWPNSTGGGARGGRTVISGPPGDTSCFDPRSPSFNITKQHLYEKMYGAEAADRAEKQFRRGGR